MARELECDLVMKGGITSGVIYPRLVSRLSEVYTFRCIGGTSAGAIAAAAAAAAQLGVLAGTNRQAFEMLDKLPDVLGAPVEGTGGSKLFSLFQPQRALQRHFALLTAALNAPSVSSALWRIARTAVWQFPIGALIGALPGIILLATTSGLGRPIASALLLLGLPLGALANGLHAFGRELPRNAFGLCNGMPGRDGGPEALTSWLHQYVNELAGKSGGEPLTFGELWAGAVSRDGSAAAFDADGPKAIQLAMMTTALNLGRPFRIPFESRDIFFVERELRPYLPATVVDWLVAHARESETAKRCSTESRTLLALPDAQNLPVLLAVRLSLSFPLLLSAVPLYAIDWTRETPVACRVYFSDGGICTNFPVHFFDAPLPSRPTFGVNLRSFHPDHPDERVWLPEQLRNNQGLKTHVPPLDDRPGLGSVFAFLSSILTTMQNWRDQIQLAMPGFRDRVVHVSHTDREGGLNLNMDPQVIATLGSGGREAADALVSAFATGGGPDSPNAWDNHRRIRVRLLLAGFQTQIRQLSAELARASTPTWDDVVDNPDPPGYPFDSTLQQHAADELLDGLDALAHHMAEIGADLSKGAPRPAPEWRATPRI